MSVLRTTFYLYGYLEMDFIKRIDNAEEDEGWLVDRVWLRSQVVGGNAEIVIHVSYVKYSPRKYSFNKSINMT